MKRAHATGTMLLVLLALGCRKREPPKVEIFDEAATPAETEALGSLAPPWQAPERVTLANGLLVHWLHEAESPAVHLRLLLPTHGLKPAHQGAAALVVARALVGEIEAVAARPSGPEGKPRLACYVELDSGIDRLEVVVHGVADETTTALAVLAEALMVEPTRSLAGSRRVLQAELRPVDTEVLATSELVAQLRGGDAARERIDPGAMQALGDDVLLDAWKALTDPRQALLVVHAQVKLADAATTAATTEMATRWRQKVSLLPGVDGRSESAAMVRLRPKKPPGGTGKHLVNAPLAPLHRVDSAGRGRAQLVLGRAIPTGNSRERSLARLAQRRLQEQFDARLTIAGSWGALSLHIPLAAAGKPKPPSDPLEATDPPRDAEEVATDPLTRRLRRELTLIRNYIRLRPTTQDLFQVAQLWLGARMVAASVAGEDWTALWSDALDLAGDDGEISAALARDAQGMLAATPEEVVAWQQRWLDFNTSEPGWAWVLVGQEADLQGVADFLKKGVSFDPPPTP